MARPDPTAAGAPLALATLTGALIGAILGQPTIGVLVGVAIGTAGAILLWLVDRRRTGQ